MFRQLNRGIIGLNGSKQGAMGGILHPSDSFRFRGCPRGSAESFDRRRKTEDGELRGKKGEGWPEWQKQGRNRRGISYPSFRQLPRKSVGIRDMCGRRMGNGISEITREKQRAGGPKWKKPWRGGRHIAPASFRQLPRRSVDARGMWAEAGRWGMRNYEENRGKLA